MKTTKWNLSYRPPQLVVGACYLFTPMSRDGGVKKSKKRNTKAGATHESQFRATVDKVYDGWYLLRTDKGRNTTMMRNALGIDWEAKRV